MSVPQSIRTKIINYLRSVVVDEPEDSVLFGIKISDGGKDTFEADNGIIVDFPDFTPSPNHQGIWVEKYGECEFVFYARITDAENDRLRSEAWDTVVAMCVKLSEIICDNSPTLGGAVCNAQLKPGVGGYGTDSKKNHPYCIVSMTLEYCN